MRVGFALANIGPIGTTDNLIRIAQRAEALAYDSLWAVERLLWPVKPQSAYPATPDGIVTLTRVGRRELVFRRVASIMQHAARRSPAAKC